jgi:stage V sporulation protein G
MTITQIKINRTHESGRMKAVVSVTFDHQIVVHDIKVIDGPERLFLAMPSRKAADGTFRDIVHPISTEARLMLENAILGKYREEEASLPAGDEEVPIGPPGTETSSFVGL